MMELIKLNGQIGENETMLGGLGCPGVICGGGSVGLGCGAECAGGICGGYC